MIHNYLLPITDEIIKFEKVRYFFDKLDLLKKIDLILDSYSYDTVEEFYRDNVDEVYAAIGQFSIFNIHTESTYLKLRTIRSEISIYTNDEIIEIILILGFKDTYKYLLANIDQLYDNYFHKEISDSQWVVVCGGVHHLEELKIRLKRLNSLDFNQEKLQWFIDNKKMTDLSKLSIEAMRELYNLILDNILSIIYKNHQRKSDDFY